MNLRTKILAAVTGSLGLLWVTPAFAYSSFPSQLPNGSAYSCPACHGGGYTVSYLTSFGNTVYSDTGKGNLNWANIYNKDSDGDGQTNGQELGDPCGTWNGGSPQYTTGLSNPGDPSSTNSIPACGPPPDTTPPTVSISSPAGGATVSGTTTVSANATDNVGVTKVDFFVDGSSIATATSSPWQASWSTASYANGSHTLTAYAYDAAGNKGTSSTVTVTVSNSTGGTDNQPPTVSLTAPQDGATVSGTAVLLSANAQDNVGVVEVDFLVAGRAVATVSHAPWQFNWNSTAVADGSYSLQAQAKDAAGNVGSSSTINITVSNTGTTGNDGGTVGGTDGGTGGGTDGGTGGGTDGGTVGGTDGGTGGTGGNPGIDRTPPEVALTAPAAGATLSGTATMSASATDNVGVTRVDFLVDGAIVASALTPPYTATFDTKFFAEGTHTLSAAAYDKAFNQGLSQGISVTIHHQSGETGGSDGGTADGGVSGGNQPQPLGGCAVSPGHSSAAFIALILLAGGLMVIRKRW